MLDNVSPGCTTYLGVGCADVAVVADAAATSSVLIRVTALVLLAMRMFAWVRGADPPMPITRRVSSMPQASTTHADFVHTRKVLHFPSSGSAPNAQVRHRGMNRWEGKELRRRNLRQIGAPDRLGRSAAHQEQQEQHEYRGQRRQEAAEHSRIGAAAAEAAGTAATRGTAQAA